MFRPIAAESHRIGTFGHGYTYSGHPVPAAVAIEALKIYDEIDIVGHVREVGPVMQAELRRRFAGHELVGEVRGTGMIGGDRAGGRPRRTAELRPGAEDGRALGQARRGARRDLPRAAQRQIAFSPPLIITEAEIRQMLDRVEAALDELTVQVRRERMELV